MHRNTIEIALKPLWSMSYNYNIENTLKTYWIKIASNLMGFSVLCVQYQKITNTNQILSISIW